MELSASQIEHFHEQGYIFLPDILDATETDLLRREAHQIFGMQREEVVRERDEKTARTAFAAHHYNEAYRRLGAHPRLLTPVMQLLDGPVYMHQFKINAKAAFNGDVWQWHQDYGTWARDDLMPTPRAMNIALFLDEVTEFNGALMFIPRSHHQGTLEAGHDLSTTSYPLWTISNEAITQLVREGGLIAPKGKPGSVMLFHSNLVHGSPSNMSPFDRTIVYLSLCHVDNHIQRFQRAEWIAHRDFTPIQPLDDNCLRDLAQEQAA
jgi:ectoine hydroxylase